MSSETILRTRVTGEDKNTETLPLCDYCTERIELKDIESGDVRCFISLYDINPFAPTKRFYLHNDCAKKVGCLTVEK